jgi:hypothetical protein
MAYGFEVYNSDGTLVYSTDSITWMQVDSFYVNAGQTITNNYPEFSGWTLKTFIELIDQSPSNQEHYSPISTISGTSVTVGPQSGLASFPARVIILAQN